MIDTIAPSRILFVMFGLAVFGWAYNAFFVANAEEWIPPRDNTTAFEVVIGTTITLAGLGFMIGPARVTGLDVMLLAFLCFASSGTPMVLGSLTRAERLPG
jgi:heme/copper-type cytochrome/quinol oxidase subunit 3